MITLRFSSLQTHHSQEVGPARGFRIAGNFVRQIPEGTVVACYERHTWKIGNRYYVRYECPVPVVLHFEDAAGTPTETFGPFKYVFAADGAIYADNELFAKYVEETVLWHSYRLETYWPSLVIATPP